MKPTPNMSASSSQTGEPPQWTVKVQMPGGSSVVMGRFDSQAAAQQHAAIIGAEGFSCTIEASAEVVAARPRIDRRRQLIEATMEELAEGGWSALTLANIAKRAGLTAGALFNHFDSKEHLLKATLAHMVRDFDDAVAKQIAKAPDDPLNLFEALVAAYIGHSQPKMLRLWAIFRAEAMEWFVELAGPSDATDHTIMRQMFCLLGSRHVERDARIMKTIMHGSFRQILTGELTQEQARDLAYSALYVLVPDRVADPTAAR